MGARFSSIGDLGEPHLAGNEERIVKEYANASRERIALTGREVYLYIYTVYVVSVRRAIASIKCKFASIVESLIEEAVSLDGKRNPFYQSLLLFICIKIYVRYKKLRLPRVFISRKIGSLG